MTKQTSSPSVNSRWSQPTRLWRAIVNPSPAIHEPERHRRAQMLSSILFVTVLLGLVSIILTLLDTQLESRQIKLNYLYTISVAVLILGGVYALSRTVYLEAASMITTAIILLTTFMAIVIDPSIKLMPAFFILGGVTSGYFFSPRTTFIIFLLTQIVLFVLAAILPDYPIGELVTASFFILVVGTLVTIGAKLHSDDLEQIKAQSRKLFEREKNLQEAILSTQQANEKLTGWVERLEKQTEEITLLSRLAEMLQICQDANEAYAVICKYASQLFPAVSGAVYLINDSQNYFEPASVWGKFSKQLDRRLFKLTECWALRSGKTHLVQNDAPELPCNHVVANGLAAFSNICLPMMAQGEALGILHLIAEDMSMQLTKDQLKLGKAVSEQLSLAVANIKLRETLRHQSIRDPLTGLFNRRYLVETLEREFLLAKRNQKGLGVIMLDIDHFKDFNDAYGHEAGDKILSHLGKILLTHSRKTDIACRYGGEEFVLILLDAPLEKCQRLAEKLRERVASLRVSFRGQHLDSISISLGVAAFPQHTSDQDALLRIADAALYQAKQEGRNRVITAPLPERPGE